MSNALRIGNRSISYEQAKEMLFPELIPQKGNEAMLSTVSHEKVEDMAVVFRLDLHSVTYRIPKKCVSIRPPYSTERRKRQAEDARIHGLPFDEKEKNDDEDF